MKIFTLKLEPEATKPQIDAVVAAFRDLKKQVPGMQDLSWGTSDKDRDAYLVHLKPHLTKTIKLGT